MKRLVIVLAALLAMPALAKTPAAIFVDPARDAAWPARMEVLHVPSGGVAINAVAYLASGPGRHPTLVLCHGWPGNEKNLDLAQAVRRAGWNAVTFNYRGSWGSPGTFRLAHNPDDARAVLAYLRDPANAAKLGVDADALVLAGHSMGGWVTVMVAAGDRRLLGAAIVSIGDIGTLTALPRAELVKLAADNAETLNATPDEIADEIAASGPALSALRVAPKLVPLPFLALTSDDGLRPQSDAIVKAVLAAGGTKVVSAHFATDHGWSDRRIALQTAMVDWLATLVPQR